MNSVLIFRQEYLPSSETFVADHITNLHCYRPIPIFEHTVPNFHADLPQGFSAISSNGLATGIKRIIFHHLGYSRPLAKLVRVARPNLLHAHFLTDAALVMRFAARHKIPLVATAHGYDASMHDGALRSSPGGKWLVEHRAELAERVARVFCVSEFIRDQLIERGFAAEKLIVQRLGVDTSTLHTDREAGDCEGVLFVGRLVQKKGAIDLVEAWTRVPAELRQQGLTIIGDGPQMVQLKRMAGPNSGIRLMGAQPRTVVLDLMRRHRIVALPSRRAADGDSEGLPIVAMEAQALARPLVGFIDGPIVEAIEDGTSGIVVPKGDLSAYAKALERLLSDGQLASSMGANGRRRAEELFDLTKNNRVLEQHYDSVVSDPATASASPPQTAPDD